MKKILSFLIVVILAAGLWWVMRPSGFDTGAPLVSQGDAIDLLQDLDTDNLSEGWVHRTFLSLIHI